MIVNKVWVEQEQARLNTTQGVLILQIIGFVAMFVAGFMFGKL